MSDKKVLVVDLDGTLYSINTFHYFLKYLTLQYIKSFQIGALFYLIFFMTLRVLRLLSHSKMKYYILKQIKTDVIDYESFAASISKYKVDLKPMSDESFTTKILATAAPTCYAEVIAKNEGFDICLGTDFPQGEYHSNFENVRENKKITLETYLNSNNIKTINLFVTDHIDDAFCLKFAEQNLIVNPDKKFLDWLTENNINYEVYNSKTVNS